MAERLARRRQGARARAVPWPGSRLEHRFEVDLDADLRGDQQPAALEDLVPGQAPVFAVEGAAGGEDGPVAAPGVGGVAEVFHAQGDRSGDAADGQLSGQHSAGGLPARGTAGEGGGGVAAGIEEVWGAQVVIAGLAAGVN